MSDFNRGDIVFVENPMQTPHGHVVAGNHPAVVIQNDAGNEHSNNLIIAYITSQLKRLELPTHVVLQWYGGLKKVSVVQTEQLATIDKGDVISVIDHLTDPQMMLYALGALNLFDCLYDIEQVTMTIFQPRLSSISTWTITAAELYQWAEEVLKPKAELAAKGEGEFVSGSWCRFCKARNTCRARAESLLELAKMEFQPPALLSDEEVAEVMEKADELSKWANDVMAYAQAEAIENGKHWNGYKLVEGRSVRKFSDEAKVEAAAKEAGYTDIYNKSLITLTAFEKLMGKKNFADVLGQYVTKPAGKLTLVPVSDKRPEVSVNTVNDEFQED